MAKDEAGRLSIIQGIMLKSTDFLLRIIAPAGGQGGVTMSYHCSSLQQFSLEDYVWCVSGGRKHCSWWCAFCGEKYDWRAPSWLLVVQTGDSANQAMVFKAHAVPQGLRKNLINALELLADQQKDGDSPVHSIVKKDFVKQTGKALMEGLRNFIEVDKHSALDLGYLKEGTRSFEVRRPKIEEEGPEVSIREGLEELKAQNRGRGLPEIVYQC